MISVTTTSRAVILLLLFLLIIPLTFNYSLKQAEAAMDPAGCANLTDTQLRNYGYEPVRAWGAKGNGITDDTAAIQNAINAANNTRRVVYLHPGTYLVSKTLNFIQDTFETRNNGNNERFGTALIGSYCGTEKPTIRLKDGIARTTNESTIAAEPYSIIVFWRNEAGATGPDDSNLTRDWNQTIRNVKIVTGNNPGAVGLRMNGAEGTSMQEVTVDARGGFAGIYNLNGSGGYSYNVEVVGGKYGIYQFDGHGGSILIVGLKLSDQENTPIVINGYTPTGIVGFDITHKDGQIVSGVKSKAVTGKIEEVFHDSGGHFFMVDGKIDITGGTNALLHNTNRAVYMKNVYVRGKSIILDNDATTGQLRVADPTKWTRISEFSYSGPFKSLYGELGHWINGTKSELTYYNGNTYPTSQNITVSETGTPSPSLMTNHLYQTALCNVEANNNTFVTDFGANPNDTIDDTRAIQAAIEASVTKGNRVFLPASKANTSYALQGHYKVSNTLQLKADTTLCGVTRYSSILDASGWSPKVDSPVIRTVDSATARTTIADFKIVFDPPGGYRANGQDPIYNPHVYALDWKAGASSLYRDVHYRRSWGDPGDARAAVISSNGGGRWYGVTQHVGYTPSNDLFRDANNNLKMSPRARQMLIIGTSQPLTFYPYHAQHITNPIAAIVEVNTASNVTFYGIKSEIGSVPDRNTALILNNPANLIPVWMYIRNSKNIALIGHEGHTQTAKGRGLIEIINSSDVTITQMGRRGNGVAADNSAYPLDQFYFVKDASLGFTAQGVLAMYKSDLSTTPIVKYQCSDGIDNDGDGKIDFLNDPDCTDALDNDEQGTAAQPTPPPTDSSQFQCGTPSLNGAVDSGLFLSRDCTTNAWTLTFLAGSQTNSNVIAKLTNSVAWCPTCVRQISIEQTDVVSVNQNVLDLQLTVASPWKDDIDFVATTPVCLSADVPVFVGKNKSRMTAPFDISTLGSCDAAPQQNTKEMSVQFQNRWPAIDGVVEPYWNELTATPISNVTDGFVSSATDLAATYRTFFNKYYLYVLVEVTDDKRYADSPSQPWLDDGIELYLDVNNDKADAYGANDYHYVLRWGMTTPIELKHGNVNGIRYNTRVTNNGYVLEARIPFWSIGMSSGPTEGTQIGFDIAVNDDDTGGDARSAKISWSDQNNQAHLDPSVFGTATLTYQSTALAEPDAQQLTAATLVSGVYERFKEALEAIRHWVL